MSVASIIIPTYNHAEFLLDAIKSAMVQTIVCEIIVVDDGSTDDTEGLVRQFNSVRYIKTEHLGPCNARNVGIEASTCDFLMFLDADDLIHPRKIELQLHEMLPEIGWVLCDVQIDNEATRSTTKASVQYRYGDKKLDGWIKDELTNGNFIPVMSPLVRRSALGDIRFKEELIPEDWHFWHALSAVARVRYCPHVLATYRHRRSGRSRIPKKSRKVFPTIEDPLRLNLGCGTPSTRSWHPIKGMVNLDKSLGWQFEDGLGEFVDGSVHGITISHSLMYVAQENMQAVFDDIARVLKPGGVVRVTEDDALNPQSSRYGGWKGSEPANTLLDARLIMTYMERAGLTSYEVGPNFTRYKDKSLMQAQHGDPPDVFFVEGVRENAVFFSPHNDDETLFGAFTIIKYKPTVVVCYPGAEGYGDPAIREQETREAMTVLGDGIHVEQWQGGDIVRQMQAFEDQHHPTLVFAPSRNTSHKDHRAVADTAGIVFGDRVRRYHTYNQISDILAKVKTGSVVPFEPYYVERKLRALCRYPSQINHPRAHIFFTMSLNEFYE